MTERGRTERTVATRLLLLSQGNEYLQDYRFRTLCEEQMTLRSSCRRVDALTCRKAIMAVIDVSILSPQE